MAGHLPIAISHRTRKTLRLLGHRLRSKHSSNLRVGLLIGDGAEPIEEIKYPPTVFAGSQIRLGSELADDGLWPYYEFARFYTGNVYPGFLYFAIYHLLREQLIDFVVTTNYDLFLDTINIKLRLGLATNPIHRCQNTNNYYTRVKSRAQPSLWKIHGSLGHLVFRECGGVWPHLFAAPPFLMGFNTRTIRETFPLRRLHNYMGWLHRDTSYQQEHTSGHYTHFTDNAFIELDGRVNRDHFRREIEAATDALKAADVVIAIGFRAGPGEELSESLLAKAKKGRLFFFMSHSQMRRSLFSQRPGVRAARDSGAFLRTLVRTTPNRIGFFPTEDRNAFAEVLLSCAGYSAPHLYSEYLCDWVNGTLFIDPAEL